MNKLVNVILANDETHTPPQRVPDWRPGLGGLNQVYGPNRLIPSAYSICGKYNTFTMFYY